jgi:Zn ribbon nucleic-acid-binding protein
MNPCQHVYMRSMDQMHLFRCVKCGHVMPRDELRGRTIEVLRDLISTQENMEDRPDARGLSPLLVRARALLQEIGG